MQIAANGLAIEVDDQGPPGGVPLLMIMGLGMQLTAWPDELVRLLVARGFRVVRFDNRDTGLSQGFEASGMPNLAWATLRFMLHLPVHGAVHVGRHGRGRLGVLDALGIDPAHVCGASMGGMIAQHMAASRPERVSRPDADHDQLGLAPPAAGQRQGARGDARSARRRADDVDSAVVARLMRLFTLIGSPAYPPDPAEFAFAPGGLGAARVAAGRRGAATRRRRRRRRPHAAAGAHHARRRTSCTAPTTRWCRWPQRMTCTPRSPARRSRSSTAWATTCRRRCGRASPR